MSMISRRRRGTASFSDMTLSINVNDDAIKFNFLARPDFASLSVFDFSIDDDTPIFNGILRNTTCGAQA